MEQFEFQVVVGVNQKVGPRAGELLDFCREQVQAADLESAIVKAQKLVKSANVSIWPDLDLVLRSVECWDLDATTEDRRGQTFC